MTMSDADPRLREIVQTAMDLQNKCNDDVQSAIGRNIALLNDQSGALVVTMGAPIMAAMFAMGLMTPKELLDEKLSNEQISERCLFAMLFCWSCREPERQGRVKMDEVIPKVKRIWEAAMGKPFDASWLLKDFAQFC